MRIDTCVYYVTIDSSSSSRVHFTTTMYIALDCLQLSHFMNEPCGSVFVCLPSTAM